jgi:hypothetical protein
MASHLPWVKTFLGETLSTNDFERKFEDSAYR